jgi:hypothetical protein
MKITGLLKILNLVAPLFILSLNVFGQNTSFKPDVNKDAAWIEQSLIKANQQDITNKDTSLLVHKWLNGKVLYCSDGSLKATQLIANPDTFTTTIQYSYLDKVFEQHLDYTDLSSYSLNKIYRLPDKEPSYLFLLSKIENEADYEQEWLKDFYRISTLFTDIDFKHVKKLTYVAVALRFKKDSLVEVKFPSADSDGDVAANNNDLTDTINTTTIADTNSFGFTSLIKQSGKHLRPYLKYDTLKHTLKFLNVYCKQDDDNSECTHPFLTVESGTYQYKDEAFALLNDTSYYYPSLPELDKVTARQNYKTGKYIIKARTIEGYEEEYGGVVGNTLTREYKIGAQTLTTFNNDGWEKTDLKPDCRLQKKGSLILLLEDATNDHRPGVCGSGSHFDSYFWLVDGKSSVKLFSFSTSSCSFDVDYAFKQNGEEISGKLYLTASSNNQDCEFDSYWKNSSTYVLTVSDSEKSLARNFYVFFNAADKKNPVKLTAGNLYKKKR